MRPTIDLNRIGGTWWVRVLTFVASITIPYVLFALITGQPQPENLKHLATFGGRAFSAELPHGPYEIHGFFDAIKEFAAGEPSFRLITPALFAALLLLFLNRSSLNIALVVLFVVPLAQLHVRTYSHYLQIAIPWAIATVAVLVSTIGSRTTSRNGDDRLRGALVLIAALPFINLCLTSLHDARTTYLESRLLGQKRLAESVLHELPHRDNVLILHGPWLYLLADLEPPEYDYTFLESIDSHLVQKATYVILFPVWWSSFEQDRSDLESRGFKAIATFLWRNQEVILYRNTSDLPAFFGPSQTWQMASAGRFVEQRRLNSAGVRLPRLECGRTSL